jgi:integrase
MPARAAPIYRRGKYWLDWDRRANGALRSPSLTIFWYDPDAGRVRSASTGTAEEGDAILALDRRYLADSDEAPAFCHACGQPIARAEAYLLTDAIADYRLEHGDHLTSATSVEARLKHVLDFLDAEEVRVGDGRFGAATTCAAACTATFAKAFRAWSATQPAVWRNGKGEITVSRPRSASSTEMSIAQIAAVLNHAANADPARSDKRPVYKPKSREQVQRKRRSRIGVPELAQMLRYAAEKGKSRESLHAFLIGSICTIARPSSVTDICVAPERSQWAPRLPLIDLNPAGRVQTKKFRPTLPVLPLLGRWLDEEYAIYAALTPEKRVGRGWLVNYHGRAIKSVDRAWDTMLTELNLPTGREWCSYILRHSLATIVRNRGASAWDLQGYMGHRSPSQTEVYAIGEFGTVVTALNDVISELEKLAPGTLHRNETGSPTRAIDEREAKMSG